MSNPVISLHIDDQNALSELYCQFNKKKACAGYSVAAAAFLLIGALIVISCACLTLYLPGVNVIHNVILPGILPGAGAILLSLPLIVYAVRKSIEKNVKRKEQINWHLALFTYYQVENLSESDKTNFICSNFFDRRWPKEYSSKLISDIKARYPEGHPIAKALDKVPEELFRRD